MWNRLLTFIFGGFWLVMLSLLCWSEFGGYHQLGLGASVPTIWKKILNSPDASAMTIKYEGDDIGWCKWAPTILEGGPKSKGAEDARVLEGMVRDVIGYGLTVEGAFTIPGNPNRYQFKLLLNLDKPDQWREFNLRFNDRATKVNLKSSAIDRELEIQTEGGMDLDTKLTFDDLQNPGMVAGKIGGPLAALALANLPFIPRGTNNLSTPSSFHWEGQNDWTRVLNERVRCYRLTTKLLDRYEITVLVSRAGEILNVSLPGGVSLVNNTGDQMM
ncbi:hypothetical protein GC207_14640 [bacterium]|nr:hypothetical protein [bacterium]